MNSQRIFWALLGFSLFFGEVNAASSNPPNAQIYHVASEITFGGKGGWDYPSLDSKANQLYITHADRLIVIDIQTGKVLKEVLNLPGIHGFVFAPELQKGFSSNGKDQSVSVINLNGFSVVSKIKVGEDPDAILYDPKHATVYAFNGKNNSASVIDAKSEKVIDTIALPGTPEFSVLDLTLNRIFLNIEDKNLLISINTETHKIANSWKTDPCDGPSGLAIDEKNHHLFSVCENEKMVMIDGKNGKILAEVTIGKGADGAVYDSELGLAFSANGKSGTLTIAKFQAPDQLILVQNLKTQASARTIALDPKTHRIYLPAATLEPAKAGERPKVKEGSQKVLVVTPE